ncbi:MAG: DnaD domain protein [Halanaerobiaceae bacterium]
MYNNRDDYLQLPISIFKDKRLKSQDIAILSFFFFLKNKNEIINFNVTSLRKRMGWTESQFDLVMKRLERFNWINYKQINEEEIDLVINILKTSELTYNQQGSRIAQSWNKYFPTRLIRYEDVQELKKFVIDGMEEELVLKIMKYSSTEAERPFHYTRAILMDLFRRGILTVDEYEKKEDGGEHKNGQQVSGSNKEKETRNEDEIADEYYKKGYR